MYTNKVFKTAGKNENHLISGEISKDLLFGFALICCSWYLPFQSPRPQKRGKGGIQNLE